MTIRWGIPACILGCNLRLGPFPVASRGPESLVSLLFVAASHRLVTNVSAESSEEGRMEPDSMSGNGLIPQHESAPDCSVQCVQRAALKWLRSLMEKYSSLSIPAVTLCVQGRVACWKYWCIRAACWETTCTCITEALSKHALLAASRNASLSLGSRVGWNISSLFGPKRPFSLRWESMNLSCFFLWH